MTRQSAQSVFTVTLKTDKENIILDNDDIKDIYFIEDIYSYLMTGRIIMRDTRGLVEFLPIVGNERIEIEYGTSEGVQSGYTTKIMEFVIIKMGWIENTSDTHRHMMELFFIQEPHKRLHMERYSLSYKCMFYTDIIKDICDKHIGIRDWIDFEDSNELIQYFYTGLKSPAQSIEWLASRCSGAVSTQPGYFLFSNTRAEGFPYNFVTIEKLLQNRNLMVPEAGPYSVSSHNEYNINRILNYRDDRVDKKSLEYLVKSIGIGWDIKRKRYLKNEYTYQEALTKFTCLGRSSLFDVELNNLTSVGHKLTGEFDDEFVMKNFHYSNWIKRYCLQHTVTAIIEGHVDRYAGGMIEIDWPTANDDEVYDKNMSGLYLVKSITHSFSPMNKPVYIQKMVLIKNGYDKSDSTLTPAVKTNLSNNIIRDRSSYFDQSIRFI